MSKYNRKAEPRVPTEVNKMGEAAYKLSPKEEFVSTILTTFLQNSYYETETETVRRIKNSMAQVDPLFAAKAAIYARDDANMRSVTHLIAGELPGRISGKEWGKRFYKRIAVRPDDMAEILSYYFNVKRKGHDPIKIPASMKKGFKEKMESMDPYLIDKYKMEGRQFSLKRIMSLVHPVPNQMNTAAYNALYEGKSLSGLYASKIFEKEMSKTGGKTKSKQEVDKAKEEAITSVLSNVSGMPIFNLLRNLRNIILYAPDQVNEACRQLTIRKKIHNSRLLPFRFLSAYEEISKLTSSSTTSRSKVVFEDEKLGRQVSATELSTLKRKVLDALNQAMNISCENIPKLEGRTAVLIDHSGSMRGDAGGDSLVSAFSRVRSSMIANLFGTMVMMGQDNVFMGLFGDRLVPVSDFQRSKGILYNAKHIHNLGAKCGGATEQGIYDFFIDVVRNKTRVDNVIVFSDMVIGNSNRWYGTHASKTYGYGVSSGEFQRLFKDFRKVNPNANVISVDIKQTGGTSVFDKSLRVTQVSGWSQKIFDHIKAGTAGYKEIIKEIEAIEI